MLRAGDFGGVQAAIDVDDGFALARQGVCGGVVEAAAVSEALRDLLVVIELREIGGRRDDGDFPIEAAGGFADGDQLDAIGGGGEVVEVVARFVVVGEVEIVAGLVAEHGFGGGDGLGGAEGHNYGSEQKQLEAHFSDGSAEGGDGAG